MGSVTIVSGGRRAWCRALLATSAAAVVLLASAAGAQSSQSAAKPNPPLKLTVAVVAVDPSNAQLWLAKQAGYFAAENLDVKIQVAASNTLTLLVGGQADLAMIGVGTALLPVRDGKETSVIYNYAGGGIGAFVAAKPGIQRISECKRMAVIGIGSSAYAWATLHRKTFNASYDLVPVQDTPTVPLTVLSGNADCGTSSYAAFSAYLDEGKLIPLVDTRKRNVLPPWQKALPEGVVFGMTQNLQGKRGAIVRFVRAFQRTLTNVIHRETPAQLAKRLRTSDDFRPIPQERLTKLMAVNQPLLAPLKGRIPYGTWDEELDFLVSGGLSFIQQGTRPYWYSRRVDMSYYNAALKYRGTK